MRRGYYGWDEAELPLKALEERCARLQTAMRAQQLDGVLLYTNIARPAAVSWLTGFTPYWSEGVLFVPADGPPDFATALSKRVAEWMRAVTPIGSIVNTPQPSAFFGKRLAQDGGAKRLGVLELDLFPTIQATTLLAAAPGVELVDATALFHAVRRQRDGAEQALFAQAAALADRSFAQWRPDDSGAVGMGAIEKAARDGRAEDVAITIASDLTRNARFVRIDRSEPVASAFALRMSLAYKSTWVRDTRSVARDPTLRDSFVRLDEAFAQALRSAADGRDLSARLQGAFAGVDAKLVSCAVECCLGSYPLEAIDLGAPLAGSVVTVRADVAGAHWVRTRPVVAV